MKKLLIPLVIIAVFSFSACSAKRGFKSEFDFGNQLAKEGLWKEAHYRWKKALAQGKGSAALYNNIAIALEEMGKFAEAEKAYKKALKLSPNNQTIQSNYDKMKKHLRKDKDKKKSGKKNEKETKK